MPNKIMKKRIIYCFSLLLLFITGCASNDASIVISLNMNTNYPTCTTLENGNNQKANVILLLGQSNASGASITEYLEMNVSKEKFEEYENGYDNVLINFCIDDQTFSSNGQFVKTNLECGSGNGFFGPEVGLAEVLSRNYEKTFILKYTMSGYSLNYHWLNENKRASIYNAFIIYAQTYLDALIAANYDINLSAICWMQGESDTTIEKANRYYDNQVSFVSYLREDLKKYSKNEIYFIDAGISNSPYCEPGYPIVNKAKEKFAALSPYNIYFSTIDLDFTTTLEPDYNPDLGHYDSLCEIALGNKFGEEIVKVIS